MSQGRILVIDIDNTLYDWVCFYIPCFLRMVDAIRRITGIDVEDLKASFQRVHRIHGTTEYTFSIQELDVLSAIDRALDSAARYEKYHEAIVTFQRCRKELLAPYPTVTETLATLRSSGVILVAHSDSPIVPVSRRLRQLNLDTAFDAISAAWDEGIPPDLPSEIVVKRPSEEVSARSDLLPIPRGVRKPNIATLTPILKKFDIELSRIIYVGDSLSRDVALARAAGCVAVHADYGVVHPPEYIAELEKITYWPSADVLSDRHATLRPDFTIKTFADILPIVSL